eukprot:6391001-Pyramimonas_sp.AAC.1
MGARCTGRPRSQYYKACITNVKFGLYPRRVDSQRQAFGEIDGRRRPSSSSGDSDDDGGLLSLEDGPIDSGGLLAIEDSKGGGPL